MSLRSFIHQKSYEHIVHEVRRHPVTLVPAFLLFVLLLALPVGVYWLVANVFPTWLQGDISFPLLVLFASLYYLAIGVFVYTYFISFYLDLLVVTNDRLLDINQQGLFARTISELDLFKVQDVTSDVHGVFASLFNYGTVSIQTAGAVDRFIAENVPHPDALRQEILDLAEADRKFHTT